jgi:hypothetical protein
VEVLSTAKTLSIVGDDSVIGSARGGAIMPLL